jgi:hypothetical protein
MASKSKDPPDPVVERLDAILEILRDLFILAGRDAGLSRDKVRTLLGVNTNRISRVWRHVPGEKRGR